MMRVACFLLLAGKWLRATETESAEGRSDPEAVAAYWVTLEIGRIIWEEADRLGRNV